MTGVGYVSDAKESVTDAAGTYSYWKNGNIVFHVGGIVLTTGVVRASNNMDAASIAGARSLNARRAQNVFGFLLAVDDDANPYNGIQISQAVRDEARNINLEFDQPTSSFRSNAVLKSAVDRLSSRTAAGRRALLPEAEVRQIWDELLMERMVGRWQVAFAGPAGAVGEFVIRPTLRTSDVTIYGPGGARSSYAGAADLDGVVRFGCSADVPIDATNPLHCAEVTGQLGINAVAEGTWRSRDGRLTGTWRATRVSASY